MAVGEFIPGVSEISPSAFERLEKVMREWEERRTREARQKTIWRFFQRVSPEPSSGCWLWMGSGGPYGIFTVDGERMGAHRAAYTLAYGKIPEGLCVMHKCDAPGCVNPKHLMLGTHADNVADAKSKGRLLSDPVRVLWLAAKSAQARIHSDICGHECCSDCKHLASAIEGVAA